MQSNMESLYTWFPLVSLVIFVVGIVVGFVARSKAERDKGDNEDGGDKE